MCIVLDIKRSTYYDYLIIKEIFDESKGTYGSRRILEGVKIKYGVIFNHKKISRIMKKYGLIPYYYKIPKRTETMKDLKKILKIIFLIEILMQLNQTKNGVQMSPTSYIKVKEPVYHQLLIYMIEEIVAHVISKKNDNKLVIDTLFQAIAKTKDVHGCILHSDQGYNTHQMNKE